MGPPNEDQNLELGVHEVHNFGQKCRFSRHWGDRGTLGLTRNLGPQDMASFSDMLYILPLRLIQWQKSKVTLITIMIQMNNSFFWSEKGQK